MYDYTQLGFALKINEKLAQEMIKISSIKK